ncbi:MAG: hypothetical protein H0V89_11120 [Deltaproteobacteria bacterium]|nr:hypothetical protein [Deltaproteobacteria bacterium]
MHRSILLLLVGGCIAHPEIGGGTDADAPTPLDTDGDRSPTGADTGTAPGEDTDRPTGGETGDDDASQVCVDEINAYRATLSLPALRRWTEAEACAGDQCRQDSESGLAHGAFGQCDEWAQNECPGWPQPAESSIVDCLAMMWAEGPGEDFSLHGHYINMSSEEYTQVACGFYTTPSGEVWAIQNFQ